MITPHKILVEEYRPHKLDDIIGQDNIIKRLKVYVATGNLPHLIFSGPPGCISGDSVIFTNKGLITIKDMFENHKKMNDIKVACSDLNGGTFFKEIEEYFKLENKDIIKIKTRFGYEIKCTPEHKIVAMDNKGVLKFIEAKDINVNVSIPILYNSCSFGENVRMNFDEGQFSLFDYDDQLKKEILNNKRIGVIEYKNNNKGGNTGKALIYPFIMNEELAEFLGYFISEGNIDSNTIHITNTDKNLNERIDYLFSKVFNLTSIVSKEKRINNDDFGRHISSVGLTEFLNKLYLNKKSKEKHVPIEILRSSKEVYISFLKAIFSGDGYVTKMGRRVGYSSMSKKLCEQIQLMLLNLGIFSSLNEKDAYCNDKYCGKTYDILIQGKDVLKFKNIIGFTLEYRQNDLNMICKEIEEKGTYNQRTLKNLESYIEKVYDEFKKLGRWNDIREYYLDYGVKSYRCYTAKDALIKRGEKTINEYINGGKCPTKEKLYKILLSMKECKYMDEYKYLMNLCEMNVDYDIVEDIKYGKEDVYDITVKDLHHYIANGFIVHNSGKTTAATALAKELYRTDFSLNFLEINSSDERGIGVVRDRIKSYASVSSIGDVPFKIIFLDEADALTSDAQGALRRTIEKYTNSCRFILSCNYSSKIIEPIQSRCAVYRFKRLQPNAVILRCKYIADQEKIKIDSESLEAIAYLAEGDCRKAVQLLDNSKLSLTPDHDTVSIKDIYETTSFIEPKIMIDILKNALSCKFLSSLTLMENLIMDGISAEDIVKQLMKRAMELHLPHEKINIELVDIIGETHWRISEGANELITFKQMIAKMVKLGSLI